MAGASVSFLSFLLKIVLTKENGGKAGKKNSAMFQIAKEKN